MAHNISLTLSNLSCSREQRVLFEGLNLKAVGGDLIKIEGPNGSGKTTLLNVVAGLTRRFEGDIAISSDESKDILYLSHSLGFSERLNVIDNLTFMAKVRGFDSAKIEHAIDRVGLTLVEHQPLKHLSAGQRRRVGLALLALDSAPIVLLDEPFNAIDRDGVELVNTLITERLSQQTLILITHHQELSLPHKVLSLAQFQPEVSNE